VRHAYDEVLGHPLSAGAELDVSVPVELESLELEPLELELEAVELESLGIESHEGGVGVVGFESEPPGAPAGPGSAPAPASSPPPHAASPVLWT
jgi:hypothetical protein